MLTPENLRARQSGIGASEIAAVCGESPFASPLDVYERKVAPEHAEIVPVNEDMERGNELESALLSWTGRRLRRTVTPNSDLVRHPDHPFVIATPDGYEREGGVLSPAVGVVEVKSPGRGAAQWMDPDENPDGMPDYYRLQLHWQLLACGLPRGVLSALVWGRLWVYHVEASPILQEAMLEQAAKFWRRVEAREPPEPTAPGDVKVLGRLLRQTKADIVEVEDEEVLRLVAVFKHNDAAAKACRDEAETAKAKICALIGDHAGLAFPDGRSVTWKAAKDSAAVHMSTDEARAAGLSDETIRRFTKIKPGGRRFLIHEPKAKKAAKAAKEEN